MVDTPKGDKITTTKTTEETVEKIFTFSLIHQVLFEWKRHDYQTNVGNIKSKSTSNGYGNNTSPTNPTFLSPLNPLNTPSSNSSSQESCGFSPLSATSTQDEVSSPTSSVGSDRVCFGSFPPLPTLPKESNVTPKVGWRNLRVEVPSTNFIG